MMWELFTLPTTIMVFMFNLSVWAMIFWGLWKAGEYLADFLHNK